jgi:hypothetical protein
MLKDDPGSMSCMFLRPLPGIHLGTSYPPLLLIPHIHSFAFLEHTQSSFSLSPDSHQEHVRRGLPLLFVIYFGLRCSAPSNRSFFLAFSLLA